LENLGAPGASGANELACLMTSILPVVGGILFTSKKWYDKLISAISAGLILNIIFLCNSRGALLATVASCFVLLLTARGKARSRALIGLSLGGVAAFVLMGDPQIVSRFFTSFAGGNERDGSASSRLVLWSAGLKMLSDYPLGAGGDGFVAVHGGKYLDTGISRSTHNGFINIANDWGVQGLILQMSFIAVAALRVFKTIGQNARNEQVAFFGSCVLSGLAGFLVSSLFGDYLDQEWGFWFAAIAWGYVRYYGVEPSLRPVQPAPSRVTQVGAQLKPAL
jgi:hypothetical protein